jgi:hypothetical protein
MKKVEKSIDKVKTRPYNGGRKKRKAEKKQGTGTMTREWHELTKMTQGKEIVVERVREVESGIAIEGSFALPPLANLSAEDQVFVMAFVRSHGSLKDMENLFGISYPTVKNRVNRIAQQLQFVEIVAGPTEGDNVVGELERGEITVEEALRRLQK